MKKYKFTVTIWRDYVDGIRLFDNDQGFDDYDSALSFANYFVCGLPGYPATIWRCGCRVEDIG